MKQFFALCMLLTLFNASAQVKQFTLNGSVPVTAKKYTAVLSWNNGGAVEEAKVINGKFVIKGEITQPVVATLNLQETNPPGNKEFSRLEFEQNTLTLFLDAGVITVTAKSFLWDAVVKGKTVTNDYQAYLQQIKKLMRLESKFGEVYDAYRKEKNNTAAAEVFKIYEGMAALYYMEQLSFVKNHPSSPVSLYFTKQAIGNQLDVEKGEPMFLLLDASLQNNETGKELKELIETGKRSASGTKVADFVQPDPSGKNISLSSFRGKYVLVDFWASWCGPCRAESPALVTAYKKYKEKNFEIFSISLDENKERWMKAIKDDGYTWPQAGDMKGSENEAASWFGIITIPFNFLVNPEGVIIARNLRGQELEKTLAALLK